MVHLAAGNQRYWESYLRNFLTISVSQLVVRSFNYTQQPSQKSDTTRQPREGEILGKSYHFVNRDVFQKLIQAGSFIEHATFSNNYYGTSAKAVAEVGLQNRRCILDIDAQGVKIIKDKHQNLQPTFVFLSPPSIDSLARRLVKRGSETEESLRSRLEAAKGEMEYAQTGAFDYVIVNDDIEQAYEKLRKVALGEGTENDILPDNRIA